MNLRFPAEWEEQDGIIVGWPHEETDWKDSLQNVLPVFIEIIRQISQYEKVLLPVPNKPAILEILCAHQINLNQVYLYEIPTNDTWARDYGFITIYRNQKPVLLDFGFNGWGLKFAAHYDNQINRALVKNKEFQKVQLETQKIILEGGSIESDGNGTILTTTECLLSLNRNPHLTQQDIENELKQVFGAEKILWLDHGFLAGDDTDSHIDTLARLCPEDTILYVACDDKKDEHYPALAKMEKQLKTFQNKQGKSYRLLPLPFPSPKIDTEGKRMPATYANFLVINQAVLVPTYEDKKDSEALAQIQKAFPDRKVIGINCLPIIAQHGSLHCLTMQIPKGVLA